jgi:hypothetical protein
MDLARENGCGYMYLMATGIYSQKIFRDLKFEKLNELEYKSYLDKRGKVVLDQTEEHLSAQLFAYNFKQSSSS